MHGLEDKVVVVAGGGAIGSATVHRLADAGARVVVGDLNGEHAESLADAVRESGGHCIGMGFDIADEAFGMGGCESVRNVIVFKRTGGECNMVAGRDEWLHDLLPDQPDTCEPEWVGAEHPLFLLYTSGSTGKPKGVQHSTGGYLPSNVSKRAIERKIARGTVFNIHLPPGVSLISGKERVLAGHLDGHAPKATLQAFQPNREVTADRAVVEWVVHGARGTAIALTATADRAGTVRAEVTLD